MPSSKNKKEIPGPAFVAGATGFTGREVVRFMVESGVETFAHVRPDSPRLEEWKKRFASIGAKVDATPWEISALVTTMSKFKPALVFAALGTTRSRMKQVENAGGDPKTQHYEAVDYGLTAMLANAAVEAGIKPRFIYLSAMGAQGKNPSPYYKARKKAENAVMSSGLPYTIVRPAFIVGPDRDDKRPWELIGAKIIDAGLNFVSILDHGKFKAKYASISNIDLAKAMALSALDENAANKIVEADEIRRVAS